MANDGLYEVKILNQGRRVIKWLNGITKSNKINKNNNVGIYKTIIDIIPLYCAETWEVNKINHDRLNGMVKMMVS